MKNLIKTWSLPDRSGDRTQITLRIPYTDYARLHALKEVYPKRSVNDLLCDIIKAGLDEIVEALPTWKEKIPESCVDPEFGSDNVLVDVDTGPRVIYDGAYRKIMEEKPSSEGYN